MTVNFQFSQPLLSRSVFVLCCLALFATLAYTQTGRKNEGDRIPRDRILSDGEFFAELDRSRSELQPIFSSLHRQDTVRAKQELTTLLASRERPSFFFLRNEVRGRVLSYSRLYESETEAAKRSSEEFVKRYGADVDWRMPGSDKAGRVHTPNTVRYLARQWEAVNLALRFFLEGDNQKHLDFLLAHVKDFERDFSAGKVEVGGNDLFERFYGGHRLRNWLMMHQLLLASGRYPVEEQIRMLKLFLLHGAKLADQCTRFYWGNHQLVGLVALYEFSVLFPEFPVSQIWHDQSLKLILKHMEDEVAPDGFQRERSTHYHKLDIENYLIVQRIAALNGDRLPPLFHQRYRAMFEALVAVAFPQGELPILQDGTDSFDVRTDVMTREMSLGALLYESPLFRYFGDDRLPASLFWYFDSVAVQRYSRIGAVAPRMQSLGLKASGYYVMRSGWEKEDSYLLIDGGLAEDKPDHTHGGVLGIIGYARGAQFAPNYPVRYSDPSFRDMKNSLAKSVALVDDALQGRGWVENSARTGFGRWETLPKPIVTQWITSEGCDFFSASHDGFQGIGVGYARTVLFLKPSAWLVVDEFTSSAAHVYKQLWQGNYSIDTSARCLVQKLPLGSVAVIPAVPDGVTIGRHSVAYATGNVLEKATAGNCTLATLILVREDSLPSPDAVLRTHTAEEEAFSVNAGRTRWAVRHSGGDQLSHVGSQGRGGLIVERFEAEGLNFALTIGGRRLSGDGFTVEVEQPVAFELFRGGTGRWHVRTLEGDTTNAVWAGEDGRSRILRLKKGEEVELSPD